MEIAFKSEFVRWWNLLIGGDKTGDDRLYERMIPLADQLYDQHLEQLRKEKLI